MIKKVILLIFIFLISSVSVLSVCTLTFSETNYITGETVLAEMICSSGNEINKAYLVNWTDQVGNVLLEDSGTTPASISTLFLESYAIPITSTITEINAELIGANLEGSDNATVTLFSNTVNTTLLITNISSSNVSRLGEASNIRYNVYNGGLSEVSNGICSASIIDSVNGAPIATIPVNKFYDGIGHLEIILDQTEFKEGRDYIAEVSCMCKDNTENTCFNSTLINLGNRIKTTKTIMTVSSWLDSVTTVVGKNNYVLSDAYIDVCTELNNSGTDRIPVDIFYSYRCGGGNNATDRVLIDSHREFRGISGNTTQNQCARLKIINIPEIQNKNNTCYASTDVRVIFGDIENFPITYHTTSSNFTIYSDNDNYFETEEGDSTLGGVVIGLSIIGAMFIYLSYLIFNNKNERDN